MARVLAVCISSSRQEPKKPVAEARFIEGKGIDGDSHFGISSRQVSLLRYEDIKLAKKRRAFLSAGVLGRKPGGGGIAGPNPLGSRLKIGRDVVLLVIEKGKKPDEPHTYDYRGWCLLPKVGYFLEVVNGGIVKPGDEVVLEGD